MEYDADDLQQRIGQTRMQTRITTQRTKTQTMDDDADDRIRCRRPRTTHRMGDNKDEDNSALDDNA